MRSTHVLADLDAAIVASVAAVVVAAVAIVASVVAAVAAALVPVAEAGEAVAVACMQQNPKVVAVANTVVATVVPQTKPELAELLSAYTVAAA